MKIKINMLLLLLFVLGGVQASFAQGNQNSNFQFQITIDGVSSVFDLGACGFGYAAFGAPVDNDVCGTIEWTKDSLACGAVQPASAPGKWALIRRGTCEFGLKCLNAEQAGYAGAIVVNHYANTADDGCSVINMAAGASGDQVTIPCIFVGRAIGETIDAALAQGKTVETCFVTPRMYDAFGAFSYITPVSQVIPMDGVGARFLNRSDFPMTDVEIKVDLLDSDGNLLSSATGTIPTAEPATPVFSYVSPITPPAQKGVYTLVYSNNKYTEPRDTIRRKFEIGDFTFAGDNPNRAIVGGIWVTDDDFASDFIVQSGALYFTGDNGGKAKFITFGLNNGDALFTGDPSADQVLVFLYDADADDNGEVDYNGSFDDLIPVATGIYTLTGSEVNDKLIDVELEDLLSGDPLVDLKPNHVYYASFYYSGLEAGLGICPRFSASSRELYLNFPTTPLRIAGGNFTGWATATYVQRLQLDGYSSTTKPANKLDAAKFNVTPNPASDFVNVNINLAANNSKVEVTLRDVMGRPVEMQNLSNFREGRVQFNANRLPAGYYFVSIFTSDEGVNITPVVIGR